MTTKNGDYDIGLAAESEKWSFYLSRNYYHTIQKTNSNHPLHKFIVSKFDEVDYMLDKAGIKYDDQKNTVSFEYSNGKTKTRDALGKKNSESNSEDYSIIVGRNIGSYYVYGGRSLGKNHTAGTHNSDKFIGVTKNFNDLVVSVAYHQGQGNGWMKYDAPAGKDSWNTFVVSTSYTF
jgi:hypothetical protein